MADTANTDRLAVRIKAWFQEQMDVGSVQIRDIALGVNEPPEALRSALSKLMRDGVIEWADKPTRMRGEPHMYRWKV